MQRRHLPDENTYKENRKNDMACGSDNKYKMMKINAVFFLFCTYSAIYTFFNKNISYHLYIYIINKNYFL